MSKTGDIKKSMAKVVRFINQYRSDWVQKAFAGDQHLIDHLQSKWDSYAKSSKSSYEAIVSVMTQLDAENEKKLMEYIDETYAKGGKTGQEQFYIRYWETRKDYKRPDYYQEYTHKIFTDEKEAIDFAEGLFHNKAYYGVEVVDESGESVHHVSEEMAKGGKTNFRSASARFTHAKGSEQNLQKMLKEIGDRNDLRHKALVDAYNRKLDYADTDLDKNVKLAKDYLKGEKGYGADTKSSGGSMGKGGKAGKGVEKKVMVYQFEDLSPEAKKVALDKYRDINVDDNYWHSNVLKEEGGWVEKLKKMGWGDVEVNFSGFWSQGDGASFTTDSLDLKKLMEHFKLDKKYPLVYANADEVSGYVNRSGRYYHEHSTTLNLEYTNVPDGVDEKAWDKELYEGLNDDLKTEMVKLNKQIYKDLEEEYESQTSDEAVKDTIEANEYEFLADGRRPNFGKGGVIDRIFSSSPDGINWLITG